MHGSLVTRVKGQCVALDRGSYVEHFCFAFTLVGITVFWAVCENHYGMPRGLGPGGGSAKARRAECLKSRCLSGWHLSDVWLDIIMVPRSL